MARNHIRNCAICIFSYNRGTYLENAVHSAKILYPDFPIFIFDDNSSDAGTLKIINQFEVSHEVTVVKPRKTEVDINLYLGGLYFNITAALRHLKANEYEYGIFIQDDMQFVWSDNLLIERYRDVFDAMPSTLSISLTFFKGIVPKHRLREKTANLSFLKNVSILQSYGFCDTGLFHVNRANAAIDLFPLNNAEHTNSSRYYNAGFRVLQSHLPITAFVPWPETHRFRQKRKSLIEALVGRAKSRNPPFIKFLEEKKIRTLFESENLANVPIHEDFIEPNNWTCIAPFWFTRPNREMFLLYIKKWREDGVKPCLVGSYVDHDRSLRNFYKEKK